MKTTLAILAVLLLSFSLVSAVVYDDFEEATVNTTKWLNSGSSISTAYAHTGNHSLFNVGANDVYSLLLNESFPATGRTVVSMWILANFSDDFQDDLQPTITTSASNSACVYINGGLNTPNVWAYMDDDTQVLDTNLSMQEGTGKVNNTWMQVRFLIDNDNVNYSLRFGNTTTDDVSNFPMSPSGCSGGAQGVWLYPAGPSTYWDDIEVWDYDTYGWDNTFTPPADANPPVITPTTPNATTFNTSAQTITYDATDDVLLAECNLSVNDSTSIQNSSVVNGSNLFSTAISANGTYDYTITCEDNSTNTATSETRNFIVNIPGTPCVQNWTCSSFADCNESNITACTAVTDQNTCGEVFGGNLADYDESCVYIPPVPPTEESGSTQVIALLIVDLIFIILLSIIDTLIVTNKGNEMRRYFNYLYVILFVIAIAAIVGLILVA